MSRAGAPKLRERRARHEAERHERAARTTFHKQVRIEHEGQAAEVDEGIAPLILALWRHGFQTLGSCETQPGTRGHAWVCFGTEDEARAFQRILDDAGIYDTHTIATKEEDVTDPDDPLAWTVGLALNVAFPHVNMAAVLAAVTEEEA